MTNFGAECKEKALFKLQFTQIQVKDKIQSGLIDNKFKITVQGV